MVHDIKGFAGAGDRHTAAGRMPEQAVDRLTVLATLDAWLEPQRFKDYAPNGLQVEGAAQVRHIASGVTASLAFIQAAQAAGADTLLVHHGLFWQGMSPCVTGWLRQRLSGLLSHNLNLLAYHLPLDAHPTLGNNAQWAQRMGWQTQSCFGDQSLVCLGTRADAVVYADAQALAEHLQRELGRSVICVGGGGQPIERLAWCSGGAQRYFEAAVAAGAQAFVTGEISEPQAHLARETGVSFLACGHHATERGGPAALGCALAEHFGLVHTFIDIDNPA